MKRWQILSDVAALNLNLVKWFEAHLDSISILHELGYSHLIQNNQIYAIWAAEGGDDPLYVRDGTISGRKYWCSGASLTDQALVTVKNEHGASQLYLIDMDQPNIEIDESGWHAVGMSQTKTATVCFDRVNAMPIGQAHQYLTRPGFWHGAAGVAACWYGAMVKLAENLFERCRQHAHDYHQLYLGEISTQIQVTKQYFSHVASQIDEFPQHGHELIVRILRAQVEKTAQLVLKNVGEALGARPFCQNREFAELTSDLIVFLRQSHAAFDLKSIAELSVLTIEENNNQNQVSIWKL